MDKRITDIVKLLVLFGLLMIIFCGKWSWKSGRLNDYQPEGNFVAAVVGEEQITYSSLVSASAPVAYSYKKYGENFEGGEGQSLLADIQETVLQDMIVSTIVGKEAALSGIRISGSETEKAFDDYLRLEQISEPELLERLKSYGWSKKDMLRELQSKLLVDKYLNNAVLKSLDPNDPEYEIKSERLKNEWISEMYDKYDVDIIFDPDAAEKPGTEAAIEKQAKAYYRKKYGDSEVEVSLQNYGCHFQIDIIKNGKSIKSLGYEGDGRFYEIW